MSTILAIDTTATVVAAALACGEELSVRISDGRRRAAQEILPFVEALLAKNRLQLAQLDAIAVVNGPGSFTGMRIGVGIAQALGWTSGKPVLPISSLAACATAASLEHPEVDYWVSVLPARNEEVYLAVYRRHDEQLLIPIREEKLGTPTQLLQGLAAELSGQIGLAGREMDDFSALEASLGVTPAARVLYREPQLKAVCRLAAVQLRKGLDHDPGLALPNYVKEQMDYS